MKKIFVIFILLFTADLGLAQENYGDSKIGLSANLQGSQTNILIPIRTGSVFLIAPSIGVAFAENTGTDTEFGLSTRFYLNTNRVSPFFGIGFGALIFFPESSSVTPADFYLNFRFGGEYFISEKFSTGISSGLLIVFSDKKSNRFNHPGAIDFTTFTAVFVTVYF